MAVAASAPGPSAGQRYAAARASIVDLMAALDGDDLARPVPACPGWRVHDVVAHLAGGAFGRRSDRQLRDRFVAVDDPGPYIELLCIFGPSPVDIIE